MTLKEHLNEILYSLEEIRDEGHLEEFEIIRRINAAEYEIQQAIAFEEK